MKTRTRIPQPSSPLPSHIPNSPNKENHLSLPKKERKNKRLKNPNPSPHNPLSTYLSQFLLFSALPQNNPPELPRPKGSQITGEVRATLIRWIIQVHQRFQFLYETFFLAVKIVDEYTRLVEVRRCEYQLVGFTSLFIAAKYEEILTPKIKSFIPICDRLFSVSEVLKMEGSILSVLDFQISKPTVNWYLNFHLFALQSEEPKYWKCYKKQCQWVMEECVQECEMLGYSEKVQSLAIMHHVSMRGKFLHISIEGLVKDLGKKEIKKVKNCVRVVGEVVRNAEEATNA